MLGPPVSPERHWNTWDSAHPASLVHLPSRLAIRLAAYSARAGRYSDFPAGPTRGCSSTRPTRATSPPSSSWPARAYGSSSPSPTRSRSVGRLTVLEAGGVGAALLAAAGDRLPRGRRGGPERGPDPRPARPAAAGPRVHGARARPRPPPQPPRLPRPVRAPDLRRPLRRPRRAARGARAGRLLPAPPRAARRPLGGPALQRPVAGEHALRARRGDRRRGGRAAGARAAARGGGADRRARGRGPPGIRAGPRGPRRGGLEHRVSTTRTSAGSRC